MDKKTEKTIMELLQPLKELVDLKNDLKELLGGSSSIEINRERFSGEVITTSFRADESVLNKFRLFCSCIKQIKNQDLFSQALLEFMDNHKSKWSPPITLEISDDLVPHAEKLTSKISDIRAGIEIRNNKLAPPIRIKDNSDLKKKSFILKEDGKVSHRGKIKTSISELELKLEKVMQKEAINLNEI